jgi:DedD protein
MDEQLKRRLMGALILVTLVVIFVPMLFEDKSTGPAKAPEKIPALPKAIEETPVPLPEAAEEVAPQGAEKAPEAPKAKNPRRSGYTVYSIKDDDLGKGSKAGRKPASGDGPEGAEDEGGTEVPSDDTAGTGAPPAPTAGAKYVPAVPKSRGPAADAAEEAGTTVDDAPAAEPKPVAGGSRKASGAGHKADRPATKPASPPKAAPPAAAKPAAAPKSAPAGSPAKAAPAKSGAAPAGTPGSYSVRAGSFNSESNAKALAEKLRKGNLPAHVRVIKRESGTVYQVDVGPDMQHSRAQEIRDKVETTGGVKAIVVPKH